MIKYILITLLLSTFLTISADNISDKPTPVPAGYSTYGVLSRYATELRIHDTLNDYNGKYVKPPISLLGYGVLTRYKNISFLITSKQLIKVYDRVIIHMYADNYKLKHFKLIELEVEKESWIIFPRSDINYINSNIAVLKLPQLWREGLDNIGVRESRITGEVNDKDGVVIVGFTYNLGLDISTMDHYYLNLFESKTIKEDRFPKDRFILKRHARENMIGCGLYRNISGSTISELIGITDSWQEKDSSLICTTGEQIITLLNYAVENPKPDSLTPKWRPLELVQPHN